MTIHDLTSPPERVGNVWRFASGRTLPVISGGSDDGGVAPVAVDPSGVAPAPVPVGDPEMFPAEVVKELRKENQSIRARMREFDGVPPEDLGALAQLAGALRTGDEDGIATWLADQYWALPEERRAQIEAGYRQQAAPPPQAVPGQRPLGVQPPSSEAPLTRAEFEQMMRERDQRVEQERTRAENVARVNAEFQAEGLKPESATARAVIYKAMEMSTELARHVPIREAYAALRQELGLPGTGLPESGMPTPPGVPPVPSGQSAVDDRFAAMSPRDRTKAILEARNAQRNAV